MTKPKQFNSGDDAEFYRVIQTIDDLRDPAATDALLSELGLTRESGYAGGGLSQEFAGVRLAYLAQQRLDIQGLCFEFAKRCDVTADLGIYGHAILAAGTIGKMLEIGLQFGRLYSQSNGYQIVQRHDGVSQQFYAQGVVGAHHTMQLELLMPTVLKYLGQLRPEVVQGELKRVHLSYPAPAYYRQYHRYYNVPVVFDQPFSEFIFDETFLKRPISTTSVKAGEILAEQSERTFQRLKREKGIIDAVRHELITSNGESWRSLDDVATRLGLSGRTLRRRLQGRGATFQKLSNEVRMTLAKEYVETTLMSNDEIAILLGYAHVPAFYAAFQKGLVNPQAACGSRRRAIRDDMSSNCPGRRL